MVAIFRSVRKVQWANNVWSKETIRPTSTRCTSMFTGMILHSIMLLSLGKLGLTRNLEVLFQVWLLFKITQHFAFFGYSFLSIEQTIITKLYK